MNLSELSNIDGIVKIIGKLSSEEIVLTTDSRNVADKNLFIGLSGEKFDGYDYVKNILTSDIKTFVVTDAPGREKALEDLAKSDSFLSFILVKDSLKFLQDSARYKIDQWKKDGGIVLGLTGSNGKTTTKELLYGVIEPVFGREVYCTQGNFNNHIGVPLTIFGIKKEHKFAIIEMGTNHFGEIEILCNIANPDYGFITNIGASHLEFLENEEGVYKEKMALHRHIEKYGKVFFANGQDKYLSRTHNLEKVFTILPNFKTYEIENNFLKEEFNKWNLYCSLIILSNIFPERKNEILEAGKSVKLPDNKRTQWITLKNNEVYLDAYNANPSSMSASLKSFTKQVDLEDCMFVLGDMNELGDDAAKYHKEIGKLLDELKVKNSVFIGRYAKDYGSGFSGNFKTYETVDDFCASFQEVLNTYKYLFLKGSRSLQLERLLDITD